MTKTLSMVSHKNYNLNAESFVIFLTSKLITCFIGGFTLRMKSQSIAYLLNRSEHIYRIWKLEGEVHSIWDLWVSGLQKYKVNGFFKVRRANMQPFSVGSRTSWFSRRAAAPTRIFRPRKVRGGGNSTSSVVLWGLSPPYSWPIEWIYFTNWSSRRRIIVNLSSCFGCGPHERPYPNFILPLGLPRVKLKHNLGTQHTKVNVLLD
jgi:hypothetical protein